MEPPNQLVSSQQVIEQRIEGAPDLVNIHKDVRLFLEGLKQHVVADVELVVVMLAGDACRYGKPPITLRIIRHAGGSSLRIEVDDHRSATAAPTLEDYRTCLLERMTKARGVERHNGVTSTWAEIELVAESAVA